MTLDDIQSAVARTQLAVVGALHDDGDTVVLLGPGEGFWTRFSTSPEATDGQPDPMDRWSKRVIGALATGLGASAQFPSDGPPYPPFIDWALRSGRAWVSPVGLLVHDTAGLWLSFRGALRVPGRLDLPPPATQPCTTCHGQPCRAACPAHALTETGYDVEGCHAFLDTSRGGDCMAQGCAVRRACPVSRRHGRVPAQSAFHMRAFHPA